MSIQIDPIVTPMHRRLMLKNGTSVSKWLAEVRCATWARPSTRRAGFRPSRSAAPPGWRLGRSAWGRTSPLRAENSNVWNRARSRRRRAAS